MPQLTLRIETADNREMQVTEYICDVADCPNPAEHVLGFARELGAFAVCALHKRMLGEKKEH